MTAYSKRAFDRVLVIMLENEFRSYVMNEPYFASLAKQGIVLKNAFGVMHPSQTNYIASVAGELCGVYNDSQPQTPLPQQTIVDLVENAGLRWRAYMESYRPNKTPWNNNGSFTPEDDYPYVIKHNPFSSFADILNTEARWRNVCNESDFWTDVLNGTLPEYAWFTPNMWNDGHYLDGLNGAPPDDPENLNALLLDQSSKWLRGFFEKLRFPGPDSFLPKGTLVVITFDEADYEAYDPSFSAYNSIYDGPNQIYTVLLGDMITPGVETEGFNHYSLLRTIEVNFALGTLGKNDAGANWYRFLWDMHFAWSANRSAGLQTAGGISAAPYQNRLHVAVQQPDKSLAVLAHAALDWVTVGTLTDANTGVFALASSATEPCLFYIAADQSLRMWGLISNTKIKLADAAAAVAVLAFPAGNLLLAYTNAAGNIFTLTSKDGTTWDPAENTNCTTSGGLTLALQGACAHLFFTDATKRLGWLTRNTAPFNVLTASSGTTSPTTINQWSPHPFYVSGFDVWPDPVTPGEPEPVADVHRGRAPLAAATINGMVHLLYRAPESDLLGCSNFSLPGLLTPLNPVNYHTSDANYSDGFGTAAQAGWGRSFFKHGGPTPVTFTITALADQLVFLSVDENGAVNLQTGGDVPRT